MTTGQLLLSAWEPGLAVPLACLLALSGYGLRWRGRISARAALFGLAVLVFFVALSSPIGVLARGYLFSAHMLQHLLLLLAVPPLWLLGLPRERARRRRVLGLEGREAAAPWLAGVGAMWLWHAPILCNAAATSRTVQAIQTISLLAMGLAFWRPILAPRPRERLEPLAAVAYLFAACVACTVLGIVITLSPVEVCTAYLHPVDALGVLPLLRDGWGLSCKADQELGGLLMWVPACFVYAAAILATLGRYYAGERMPAAIARGVE